MGDEGYLWYGVQRILAGEVPIRDFLAYDPARYYWSAALMGVGGSDGILPLRITLALVQLAGLIVAMQIVAAQFREQGWKTWIYMLVSVAIFATWMFPRHKLFDISMSIMLAGTLVELARKPSNTRYFCTGVVVGVAAIFGRNHGIYGAVASAGLIAWLATSPGKLRSMPSAIAYWAAGIVVGFSPLLLMTLAIPGFGAAFLESIRFLFEFKATNLPLPVPWPWTVVFHGVPWTDAIRAELIGMFFVGLILFPVLGIIWASRQRLRGIPVNPTLLGISFLAVPYAHYAYSRADVAHLAQGIFPFLIGCLSLLATRSAIPRWTLVAILLVSSYWASLNSHPGWQCRLADQCTAVEIDGTQITVDPSTASAVRLIQGLTKKYAADGQTFIAAPFWTSAYPLMHRRAPSWEIYPILPRPRQFEQLEIDRLKESKPAFAVIIDTPLDGNDALRFSNTHPLTYQYLTKEFQRVDEGPDRSYQLFIPKP